MDNDAIDKGKVFDRADKEAFNILYSRVQTEATTDVRSIQEDGRVFFSLQVQWKCAMLSVVFAINLDGNTTLSGHVGVLVPAKDGYLFVSWLKSPIKPCD